MSHQEKIILKDSRNRIVLCTIAKDDHDDRLHFACYFCDADFLLFDSCEAHIRVAHSTAPIVEAELIIEAKPIIKMETPMDVEDTVEILSDDEFETISISDDEPEKDQPSTSKNAHNEAILRSVQMQNGTDGSTNGEVFKQSLTIKPQPTNSTETQKKSFEKNKAEKTATAPSIRNEETSSGYVTNGKKYQKNPKPSTSTSESDEEIDDDISSISSFETESNRPENGERSEKEINENDSEMPENYPCQHCSESFATFPQYRSHEYSCEAWRNSMFSCPVKGCSKKFAHRNSRDNHVDKMHETFGIRCGICPRRFLSLKKMQEHRIKAHSNNTIIPCFFCKRKFYSNYQRNCHVKLSHKYGEYECPVCEQSYKSEHAMLKHKKEVHSKK